MQAAQNISCTISVQLNHVIAFCLFSLFALFFDKRDPLFHRQANEIKNAKFKDLKTRSRVMVGDGTVKKKPSLLYSHNDFFFQILATKPQHLLLKKFPLKKRRKDTACYRLKT